MMCKQSCQGGYICRPTTPSCNAACILCLHAADTCQGRHSFGFESKHSQVHQICQAMLYTYLSSCKSLTCQRRHSFSSETKQGVAHDSYHDSYSHHHCSYMQQLRDCYPQGSSCCTHQRIKGPAFQSTAQAILCTGISPACLSSGQKTCTTCTFSKSLINSIQPTTACQRNYVVWCMSGTAMPINWSRICSTCSSSYGIALPRVQPAAPSNQSKDLQYE